MACTAPSTPGSAVPWSEGAALVDEQMDLRDVLQAGYDVVATEPRTRGLDVQLDLPSVPVPFLGDGEMLERVVVNLVDNAVKFTPAGGRVGVRLTATCEEAVFEVSDTGIGIPADEQDLLFTRFFRSSLAKRQEIPGSGLGLSITRAVVEMHGGTLHVDSVPGAGTTFEVRLPRRGSGRVPTAEVLPERDESTRRLKLVPNGHRRRVDVRAVSAGRSTGR
jgi:signal transduction histidine kinase